MIRHNYKFGKVPDVGVLMIIINAIHDPGGEHDQGSMVRSLGGWKGEGVGIMSKLKGKVNIFNTIYISKYRKWWSCQRASIL